MGGPGAGNAGVPPKLSRTLEADFARAGADLARPDYLLANHGHIVRKACLLWPAPETVSYLDQLLLTDRGNRAGFHPTALIEIMALKELHERCYGTVAARGDVFTKAAVLPAPASPRAAPRDADFGFTWTAPDLVRPRGWGELGALDELRLFVTAVGRPRLRLGEILVMHQVLPANSLAVALAQQRRAAAPLPLGQILVRERMVSLVDIDKALALQSGLPLLDLDGLAMSADAAEVLPLKTARQLRAAPVMHVQRQLVVAVAKPVEYPQQQRELLQFTVHCPVLLAWAEEGALMRRFANYVPDKALRR